MSILADPTALDELLSTLVDNAVRYTPPGGSVTVETLADDNEVSIIVRDTGPGIGPEDLEHIFEPFYRGQAQKSIPGTGLGLPIAKRIAEGHGGRVEVQTALGQGSAFRVVLPRQGTKAADGFAHAAESRGRAPMRSPVMETTQGPCTSNVARSAPSWSWAAASAACRPSLDLAESGFKVYLVEEGPAIGGAMAQLDKTFPTNDCAMCTLAPRLVDCGRHPNVEKLTYSEVLSLEGRPGRFRVRVKKKPRSVDPAKCTGCGECSSACLVRNRAYFDPAEPEPLDLDADQAAEVDRILAQYGAEPSSILPVLQDINAKYHWLPGGRGAARVRSRGASPGAGPADRLVLQHVRLRAPGPAHRSPSAAARPATCGAPAGSSTRSRRNWRSGPARPRPTGPSRSKSSTASAPVHWRRCW